MSMLIRALLRPQPGSLRLSTAVSFGSLKEVVFPDRSSQQPLSDTVKVNIEEKHVVRVTLNRPSKGNAMSFEEWSNYMNAFNYIDSLPNARVCIVNGEGKHFSTGMDLNVFRYLPFTCVASCMT